MTKMGLKVSIPITFDIFCVTLKTLKKVFSIPVMHQTLKELKVEIM